MQIFRALYTKYTFQLYLLILVWQNIGVSATRFCVLNSLEMLLEANINYCEKISVNYTANLVYFEAYHCKYDS